MPTLKNVHTENGLFAIRRQENFVLLSSSRLVKKAMKIQGSIGLAWSGVSTGRNKVRHCFPGISSYFLALKMIVNMRGEKVQEMWSKSIKQLKPLN